MNRVLAVALAAVLAAGCGTDDGASVRTVGETGTGSGTGSGTGTGTGTGTTTAASPGTGLGAYTPVSDVAAHAKVTRDVCDIAALLPDTGTIDYTAIKAIYTDGRSSVRGDGTKRSLGSFAKTALDEPYWDLYAEHFSDTTWLDSYVTAALDGTGAFSGASDAVRRQAIQKGVTNGVMVAWVRHELDAAAANVKSGKTGASDGAPHNVDEAWAFYRGEAPDCAPFSTADKRGADFGKASAVNDAMATAMAKARDAAGAGDAAGLAAASREIERLLTVTYLQAALKYSAAVSTAVGKNDGGAAAAAQAEGWSFYRVIAPLVGRASSSADRAVAAVLEVGKAPPSADAGTKVRDALEKVYATLGVSSSDIGVLKA